MNNPFDGTWGMPGTSVMQGMQAAAAANTAYQQSMQQFLKTQQDRANVPVYDLQRQIQLSDLNTALPLTQSKNRALGIINERGPVGTAEDYLGLQAALNPGKTFSLSPDKKTLYTVGADGSRQAPQPVHTGISARNNAVMTHGRNLFNLADKLPQEQYQQGTLMAQLAGANNKQHQSNNADLVKAIFGGMKGLGLGGSGKKGSSTGPELNADGSYKLTGAEWDRAKETALAHSMNQLGLFTENGVLMKQDPVTGIKQEATVQDRQQLYNAQKQFEADFGKAYSTSGNLMQADMGATRTGTGRKVFADNALLDLQTSIPEALGRIYATPGPTMPTGVDLVPTVALSPSGYSAQSAYGLSPIAPTRMPTQNIVYGLPGGPQYAPNDPTSPFNTAKNVLLNNQTPFITPQVRNDFNTQLRSAPVSQWFNGLF